MAIAAQARPTTRPDAPAQRLASALSRGLDFVSDFALLAFAGWTVIYHVGLIFDLPTNPLLLVWVVSLVAVVWFLRIRPDRELAAAAPRAVDVRLLGLAVVLAAGSALLIFASHRTWWPGWVVGAAAAVVALLAVLRSDRAEREDGPKDARDDAREDGPPVSLLGTILAVITGAGFACVSVLIVHPDADDVFYINRAAWVAQHGNIPTKDTLYSDQAMQAIRGAGVPVSSIETMAGAIAHVFGLAGGTTSYLVFPPIAVFLAVWALWRLIRAWAPRRLALCFAVAMVYLLWDAEETRSVGAFFLIRMQQGKAVFAGLLIPLLFVYLTRWVNRPDSRTAVLLAAAGVAGVGLTSSATFLVPLICAAVTIPLLLMRRYVLAAGSMLPFVYPLIVGIVVHFSYSAIDPNGMSYTGERAFRLVIGPHWFGAVGWLAVLCAVWLVRPGGPRLATSGVAVVVLILTAPGVLGLINDFTGAHAVLWRSIWAAPLPALVGVAAAVRLPSGTRWAAPAPAAVLIAAVVLAGVPVWHMATFTSRPTWRFGSIMPQGWRVVRADHYPGTVLAPYPTMTAIALATTKVHAIDPRDSYRPLIVESKQRQQARYVLARLVFGHVAPQPQVSAALRTLDVGMVCLEPQWNERRRYVQQSGYEQIGRVGKQVCYRRATG